MNRWLTTLHLAHMGDYLLRRFANLGSVMMLDSRQLDEIQADPDLLRVMKVRQTAFLGAILDKDSNICHDRLGANIEKGEI
jgi:hypothetical protein